MEKEKEICRLGEINAVDSSQGCFFFCFAASLYHLFSPGRPLLPSERQTDRRWRSVGLQLIFTAPTYNTVIRLSW